MTTAWTEEEDKAENGYSPDFDASKLFDAPDYATLLKHVSSASAKEYEAKVQAMLKAGVVGCLRAEQYADAATLLHYGPGFAQALGDLTDVSDKTKRIIDILTAPESPVIALVATAIPMTLQFMRNHEREIEQVNLSRKQMRQARKEAKARGEVPEKAPGLQVKLPFGRSITLPIRVRIRLFSVSMGFFKSQTSDPATLTQKVFEDPKVKAALKKVKV